MLFVVLHSEFEVMTCLTLLESLTDYGNAQLQNVRTVQLTEEVGLFSLRTSERRQLVCFC